MKALMGIVLVLAGIVLGVYVGVWVMFVGGIVAVVEAIKADPVNSLGIAWGIVRIVFASTATVAIISFWLLALPGVALLKSYYKG
jgi:uncharacterized membrane protein